MKICLISKWDISGGAPRATYRLFRALQRAGEKVNYIVQDRKLDDPSIHSVSKFYRMNGFRDEGLIQKNYINNRRTRISNTYFSITYNGANFEQNEYLHNSDVINLHWIEKFVSLKTLSYLVSLGKPLVWTLHDQRPFTGGCHYSAGCDSYKVSSCENCTQLKKNPCGLPAAVLRAKNEILLNSNLVVVTPSKWLAREASQSELFNNVRVEVIPNSLETHMFYPRDMAAVRSKLDIPENSFVILAGSHDNRELRKGYSQYIKAVKLCLKQSDFNNRARQGEVVVLSIGAAARSGLEGYMKHIDFGTVCNDDSLAEIYSAADVYVMATLEDNLPNTVIESMSCGTPVISFATGGIPEMVKNGENGLLVEVGKSELLANAILSMFRDPERVGCYGINAAKSAKESFSQELQALRYLQLFSELDSVPPKDRFFDEDAVYACALSRSVKDQKYMLFKDKVKSTARRYIKFSS